jgi:hypothetical protein
VKIGQHPATPNLTIRDLTVIKPHWNQPHSVWRMPAHLPDSEIQFFMLVAPLPANAPPRKARQKHHSISPNRLADLRATILPRPQVRDISPYGQPRRLQNLTQNVDMY